MMEQIKIGEETSSLYSSPFNMTNAKKAVPMEILNFAKNKSKSPTMLTKGDDDIGNHQLQRLKCGPTEGVAVDDNHNIRVPVNELDDLLAAPQAELDEVADDGEDFAVSVDFLQAVLGLTPRCTRERIA